MSNATLNETAERISDALRQYIEATYHIADPSLVAQRRALLRSHGVVAQPPFIESTPRYQSPRRFEDLDLPDATKELLLSLSCGAGPALFNPPYTHQAQALESAARGQSLLVMTGTGSGKTESFLMPILSKLATEAREAPAVFRDQSAFRALILYPMNALVNDQLGRLRRLFGDPRLRGWFEEHGGRPARFARYTSRTLYPGVRSAKKDQERLKGIETFFIEMLNAAESSQSEEERRRNRQLIETLQDKGKWPGKADVRAWYGKKGQRWQDQASGEFQRAVTLHGDVELLTRHEVQKSCPDVLITNYSMLEYMLIRPVERTIFAQTREWLRKNPYASLLLVLDEAHLYRGATGSEVALLIRRLCARLGIGPERLQAISTSASFSSEEAARDFSSNLTGVAKPQIDVLTGDLKLMENENVGGTSEAEVLARIELNELAPHHPIERRFAAVGEFLDLRGVEPGQSLERALYDALKDFPPLALLVNTTMQTASRASEIAAEVFPESPPAIAEAALSNLAGIGSIAREYESQAGLLSARTHLFFRGLPGLWVCVDPECSELAGDASERCAGKLYPEPRERCGCGARVFELFTCRDCGATYCRAYSDDVEKPRYLWSEPGVPLTEEDSPRGSDSLEPLDILLELDIDESGDVEPAELDVRSGQLNVQSESDRIVFLKPNRTSSGGSANQTLPGQFIPCGACGSKANFGRSTVQDHQTKGDEPFYALVSEQFAVQPATRDFSPSHPAQGRKLLTFADSRQSAARLASQLGANSLRDAIRPLLVSGYRTLEEDARLADRLTLGDLYLALLIGATRAGVTFTGPHQQGESRPPFTGLRETLYTSGSFDRSELSKAYQKFRDKKTPEFVLDPLIAGLSHKWFGLESLAMASVREWDPEFSEDLPDIQGVAETTDEKAWLVRVWLSHLFRDRAFDLRDIPSHRYAKGTVTPKKKLTVTTSVEKVLPGPSEVGLFEKEWLPKLQSHFCEVKEGGYLVDFNTVTLDTSPTWGVCEVCQTPQRPHPRYVVCRNCGKPRVRKLEKPDTDPVFSARKGYYRGAIARAERGELQVLNAAEHSGQLGSPDGDSVFSVAERNELLFQDVLVADTDTPAVDVLSCTTTMEVGIDIGSLAAVSLRNMPPRRSNYQQRAGRAGRRGTSVATVLAFANTESHDSHHFRNPAEMIRGEVVDPILSLDNAEIARRHIRAYLLQNYQIDRVPDDAASVNSNLFSVLGTVTKFKDPGSGFNRTDLAKWLALNEVRLHSEVLAWLPDALGSEAVQMLVEDLVADLLRVIDGAIGSDEGDREGGDAGGESTSADPGDNIENLLDRLLYKGILPRYAFPTDVVTFHVFSPESNRFRPKYKYSPSQGLAAALSQYAPGKTVHIDGSDYRSGAIYTPNPDERRQAWDHRFLYFECGDCGYAKLVDRDKAPKGGRLRCDACGGGDSLGPGRSWMRPPGFAHPHGEAAGIGSGQVIPNSYPTRAKLKVPSDNSTPEGLTDRIRTFAFREDLLVTNSGPRSEGYSYCHRCGRIEPTATSSGILGSPHSYPTPDQREDCPGGMYSPRLVLGTTFLTDLLIIQFDLAGAVRLPPKSRAFHVALRTVAEAIVLAACHRFDLEPSELNAEYRPALTTEGMAGVQVEIYLYDTLPGGAGYTSRIRQELAPILTYALELLKGCDAACDSSCYRCLRSYQNKFEHQLLDRFVGAALLEHVLDDGDGDLEPSRLATATQVLVTELRRSLPAGVTVKEGKIIEVPGVGEVQVPVLVSDGSGTRLLVSVHSPIRLNQPLSADLQRVADGTFEIVRPLNELLVRENLPAAVRLVQEEIGA
ncbi:MAG: DEAD/DEAH box helicase [Dehalococcoidia bacterium]